MALIPRVEVSAGAGAGAARLATIIRLPWVSGKLITLLLINAFAPALLR